MRKAILISIVILISISSISSQAQENKGFYLGGYYTLLIEETLLESNKDTIQFLLHCMNVNLRYAINHKWRFGIEYILSITSHDKIEDPFHTLGLTVDYDVLRTKKSKLHLRGGLSLSNILYAGDYEPKRRTVLNRVIGVSYEFRISSAFWLNAGINGHRPLNKIPYKYAFVQPFIGACVHLGVPNEPSVLDQR